MWLSPRVAQASVVDEAGFGLGLGWANLGCFKEFQARYPGQAEKLGFYEKEKNFFKEMKFVWSGTEFM